MPTSKSYHKEYLKGGGLCQFDSGTLYAHHGLHIHCTLCHTVPCTGVLKCRGVSDNLRRRGAGTAWSVTQSTGGYTTAT